MQKLKFPEEFIRHGDFLLHSRQHSNILYDVNEMLTNDENVKEIINNIPHHPHYVGIATAGAIIARLAALERNSKFSMIKDGELKGDKPTKQWILIDDVVTTGNSLKEAIKLIGYPPSEILVIVDRREKNENPEVKAIFQL